MKKYVISIFSFLSILLVIYSLSFMDVFKVGSISYDSSSADIPSIRHYGHLASFSNYFSPRFSSLKDNIESLAFVSDVSFERRGFLDFIIHVDYERGLIITDKNDFYFYSSSGIEKIDEKDAFSLFDYYFPLVVTSEMLSYIIDYQVDNKLSSLLTLLMEIQGEKGYNKNLVGRVEYQLSSGSGFGTLSFYGKQKDFILNVSEETDPHFIASCLSTIGASDYSDASVFEIRNDILIRRMD